MTRYIYVDLLFLINFLADYVILYLTSVFSCCYTNFKRLLVASFIGALFAVTSLLSISGGILLFLLTFIFSYLLCRIAFGKKGKMSFSSIIFYFYLSSILLYGGMYLMLSLTAVAFNFKEIRVTFLLLLALLLLCFAICLLFSGRISRGIRVKETSVKAELFDGYRTYTLDLICDSGNFAKDPFSGKPVSLISKNSLDSELVQALCATFSENEKAGNYTGIRPRVIPIKTVNGISLLYAFIPKNMYIIRGKEKLPIDTIVAIDNRENAFLGKDGIISSQIIENL